MIGIRWGRRVKMKHKPYREGIGPLEHKSATMKLDGAFSIVIDAITTIKCHKDMVQHFQGRETRSTRPRRKGYVPMVDQEDVWMPRHVSNAPMTQKHHLLSLSFVFESMSPDTRLGLLNCLGFNFLLPARSELTLGQCCIAFVVVAISSFLLATLFLL